MQGLVLGIKFTLKLILETVRKLYFSLIAGEIYEESIYDYYIISFNST
jgi:hypothetical protein